MVADRPGERRGWWLAPAIAYVATLVVFLAWSPAGRAQFPLDDAWIHRVYARSFAWGHGLAYNEGVQEAGCTSPLWAVISAPVHWLEPALGTAGVVWAVKLLGGALGALSVAAVYRLGRQLSGAAWPAALAASLFACEPVLAFSALSGMEVSLVVCLWLWLVAAIHGERWRLAAIMLGLLPVARPEAILLVGACVAVLAIQRRRRFVALITPWSVIGCVLPTVLWIAFCELATRHPLPNTYYMKATGELGLHGVATAFGVLVQHGWARSVAWPLVGAVALVAWCGRHRANAPVIALLALGSLLFVIAVIATRSFLPLGYYWTRWTDPGVLGVAAACALGLALGAHALVHASGLDRRVQRAALAALAIVIVAAAPGLVGSIAERAERLGSDGRVIERMNVEPGRWIAAHTPVTATVGVNDAGALRYFGGRTTVDLIGLNAADIAFGRVSQAAIEQRIDWLAIYPLLVQRHPAFASFAQLRWFSIPRKDYTICDCPGPTTMFIARRPDRGIYGAEQRQAMLAALRTQPAGARAWLAAPASEPAAVARAEELRGILIEAGWRVPDVQRLPFQPRGGLLLLAADDPPLRGAIAISAALDAAGLEVHLRPGYRAFLDHQRAAGSSGPLLELAPDQAFVLVVGRE
jgi:dolichyl-phosphate-mannose-protein mannosyltransferase